MTKIWTFIKTHFLTKKFLTFGMIGVMNTGIHMLVYYLSYNFIFQITNDTLLAFICNSVAFIFASVFSYFANAIFTFKPKQRTKTQFSIVMGVYLARLGISSLLTAGFDFAILEWLNADYGAHAYLELVAPLLGSALLIPIAYFALDWVFKKTDKEIEG